MDNNEDRSSIIKTVNNPLGFFALALLIAEGFLGIVLIFAKDPHSADLSFYGMWIGAGLFIIVVFIVAVLTWCKPDHLGLSGKDYKELKQGKFGLQTTQPSSPVDQANNIQVGDPNEASEFQNLCTFLVGNSQAALRWFKDQTNSINEIFFIATYSLPFPPPEPTANNVLNEKNAVLTALKTQNLLEITSDNKLKISQKGIRFLKFVGFIE